MLKNKLLSLLFLTITLTLLTIFQIFKPFSEKLVLSNNLIEESTTSSINKTGFIRGYCEYKSDLFLIIDEAEFYIGKSAKEEYKKDNSDIPLFEWGNDYYIRNNSNELTLYQLSPEADIELCSFAANLSTNSIELTSVSVDTFKDYVDNSLNANLNERALLFSINIEDDSIKSIYMLFTP